MKHNQLRKIVSVTAAAAMSLAPMMAMADTANSALVKGGALNLRETASLTAKVLGQYPTGTLVEIVESGSEWHKVSVGGQQGYMMAKFLKVTDETGAVKPYTATLINVNGGKIVNFRTGPSLNSKIIRTVPVGTQVTVLEHGTDWCKVDVDGETGYISTWFMKK